MDKNAEPHNGPSTVYYRTIWLSDIHLGNRDSHADYLLDFLNQVSCERLYLVGDIIDMLAMRRRIYWPASHYNVLMRINEMAASGTQVIYVPGNHDAPMRRFGDSWLINVVLRRQDIHTTADGKRLLVVHGDEFDHAIVYRTLNRLIGEPAYDFMVFMNRWLHRIRTLFGLPYWSLATYLKTHVAKARQTIETFELAAVNEAKQRGLDGVVCGHIHKAEIRYIDGLIYCNDGDWTESCTALMETLSGELQLMHWSEAQKVTKHPSRVIADVA